MKKMMLLLTALILCVFSTTALAETLVSDDYTNVSATMTQDSVLQAAATEGCTVETLQPDEKAIALLNDMYQFVWVEKNPPMRYYDEETQKEIEELIDGVNIDLLHVTEAMTLQLGGEPENPVTVTMDMDVDYRVGQLIVAVMGVPQENGEYAWYPYRGHVETEGQIKWEIPAEDWKALSQQPVSLHIASDRLGAEGERVWHEEQSVDTVEIFSKESGDVVNTRRWYTVNGTEMDDNFSAWLADLTDPMQAEVAKIGAHVENGGAILDYFPAQCKDEALLMLPEGTDPATLIPYDIIAMMAENYKDAYGDVNVEINFGTAYQPDKGMVVMAGYPTEDGSDMEWYVLRAAAIEAENENDHNVEIGMKQQILPRMMEEPVMMVVISEPIDQE